MIAARPAVALACAVTTALGHEECAGREACPARDAALLLLQSRLQHLQEPETAEAQAAAPERQLAAEVAAGSKRCLAFIHIPKTGGTSIEVDGRKSGCFWGVKDMELHNCTTPEFPEEEALDACMFTVGGFHNWCSVWHIPPAVDQKLLERYRRCDTFCVVRDPLQRLISEYRNDNAQPCHPLGFASWARHQLAEAKQDPYMDDCHFVPQVEYVYGPVGFRGKHPPTCTHVIRFENLTSEFNELIAHYPTWAPVRLTSHHRNNHCDMEVEEDTARLIEEHYAEDYRAFGYPRRSSVAAATPSRAVDAALAASAGVGA